MRAIELTSWPRTSGAALQRTARAVLLALLGVIYSGLFLFLVTLSPYLLYGFYVLLLILIGLSFYAGRPTAQSLYPLLPYLYFLLIYASWGLLISPEAGDLMPEVVRMLIRNLLIFGAFVVAVPDQAGFKTFARWVQVAALLNFAIAVAESINPTLLTDITFTRNVATTAFDVLRPAGLWINPDEAAFAFLFALLLSSGDRGLLIWLGRAASIGGIYLSASRTGVYILAGYLLALLVFKLRSARLSQLHLFAFLWGAALVITLSVGYYNYYGNPTIDTSDSFQISRILDFHEESAHDGYTRRYVTSMVFDKVLEAPVQGYGVFSLQTSGITSSISSYTSLQQLGIGAHNIYLVVWGELGIFGLLCYLIVLLIGIIAVLRARISAQNRCIGLLIWATYLLMGLVWHNQFTDVLGTIYVGLIFYFPRVVASRNYSGTAPRIVALPAREVV